MTEGSSAIRGGQGAGPPPLRGSDPPPTLDPSGGSLLPFGAVFRGSPPLTPEPVTPSITYRGRRAEGDPRSFLASGASHLQDRFAPVPVAIPAPMARLTPGHSRSCDEGGRPHPRPPSLTPEALPTGRRATRRGRLDICDTMATTDREGGGTSPRSAGTGGDQIEEERSQEITGSEVCRAHDQQARTSCSPASS